MAHTFYKLLFEIRMKRSSTPAETSTAFELFPTLATSEFMRNYNLKYRCEPGLIKVYYSGKENVITTSPRKTELVPAPALPEGAEFVFVVRVFPKSTMAKTTVVLPTDVAEELKVIDRRGIRGAMFSEVFDSTASTDPAALFQIFNAQNTKVAEHWVNKDAENQYICSVDLRSFPTGFYTFTLGSKTTKYYIDVMDEIGDGLGIIRTMNKNSGTGAWKKPIAILPVPATADFNQFSYTFTSI